MKAGLILLAVGIGASAAALTCTAQGPSMPILRVEGTTELVGDIVVTCTGGTPTASGVEVPTVNFALSLNAPVTSRVFGQNHLSPDALVFIDEPNTKVLNSSTTLLPCLSAQGCPVKGTGTGIGTFSGVAGRFNVFQGAVSGNQVTFFGVPVDPPGDSNNRVYRFKGIRVNATGFDSKGLTAPAVMASIAISGAIAVPVSSPTVAVAFANNGLNFNLRNGSASTILSGGVVTAASGQTPSGVASATVRFSEKFANAFRPRTTAPFTNSEVSPAPATQDNPAQVYNSESGMVFSVPGLPVLPAEFGTRLKAEIDNVPAGVSVWVGVVNNGAAATKTARLTQAEATAFTPVPVGSVVALGTNVVNGTLTSVAQIPVTNGHAIAIWEVLAANPTAVEDFDFAVWFVGSGSVSLDGILGGLAPNPTNGALDAAAAAQASSVLPIPRFADPLSGGSSHTISQVVDGAGWKTTIILVNTGALSADFTIRFWDEQGIARSLPLVHDGLQAEMVSMIPAGGSRTIETQGLSDSLSVVWAEIVSPASIGGLAIFRQSVAGRPDQEAAVPLASNSGDFVFPFDNTSGAVTSMALVNTNATTAIGSTASFRGEDGTAISSLPFNLSSRAHTSFSLLDAVSGVANRRGVTEFSSPAPNLAAIGLRFLNDGAFTSLPVLSTMDPNLAASGRNLSQLVDGGGWKTTFILTNIDTAPAQFRLNFWKDDGTQLPLQLGNLIGSPSASFFDTIPVGGSLTLESQGGGTVLSQGWAELITNARIGGLAIFRQTVSGRPNQEAAVPIATSVASFVLPFDNTQNFVTSMALVNTGADNPLTISATIQDEGGNRIGTSSLTLGPREHTAFSLSTQFPGTANARGTVLFSAPSPNLSGLGLRFNPGGAFTSFPVLPK